jgi:hypothetical protein
LIAIGFLIKHLGVRKGSVFGPYIKLPRGKYRACYFLERGKAKGLVEIDVSIGNGNAIVAKEMINLRNLANDELCIDFELTGWRFESCVKKELALVFRSLLLRLDSGDKE